MTAYEGAAAFYIFGSQYLLPGARAGLLIYATLPRALRPSRYIFDVTAYMHICTICSKELVHPFALRQSAKRWTDEYAYVGSQRSWPWRATMRA